jgi:hypothetical protein
MAKYRKVDPRIWNDAKFRDLSDSGKLVFFFLLTHPNMTSLGAMRHTIPGMAAELGWENEGFREPFMEVLSKGLAKHDERASFVWLPKFIKYNPPENPNVVKAWDSALDLLPECDMFYELLKHVELFLKELPEGFRKPFRKGLANQEQEQEQEQKEEGETPPAKTTSFSLLMHGGVTYEVPEEFIFAAKSAYPLVDIESDIRRASAWLIANPAKRRKDAPRFLNNWFKGSQKDAEEKAAKFAPVTTTGREITENDCRPAKWAMGAI